jgi:hypothetical protein
LIGDVQIDEKQFEEIVHAAPRWRKKMDSPRLGRRPGGDVISPLSF